ncbi:MAG: hypothetical protein EOP51_00790 [Sphingobacteriales bacterium]|nr:MAG: hypothetical protein EOP51_00790 [Sphingobacteriales bacterium]
MSKTLVFKDYWSDLIQAWRSELSDKSFRMKLIIMPGLFFAYSAITQHLGNYIQMRKGIRLTDTILNFLPTQDFSVYIFALLYASLSLIVITHLNKPRVVLRLLEMHLIVAVVRQTCILLIALEPPVGIIVLRDVFLENTVYPHTPLTKDLFFSGHIASIWIYFLCATKNYLKIYFAAATFLMGFMLLSMRVHYSYDVYGAIIFTTLIYLMPTKVRSYYVRLKQWP